MLGVIFGIVRGVIIAALLMMLSDLTPFTKEKSWRKSLLVPHIKPLENWLNQFLPDSISSHSGGSEPIA
jgi:membrane protein required for colicin V production